MKKFLIAAASAAFLAACSAPEGMFNLSIDIPEAGNSPVRISLEDNQTLFEGELIMGSLDVNIDDILPQHVMVQIEQLGAPGMYFHEGTDVGIAFDSIVGFNITAGPFQDSVSVFNKRGEIFNNTMSMLEIKFRDAMTLGDTAAQEQIRAEAMNLIASQSKSVVKFAKNNNLLGAAIILSQATSDITYEDFIQTRDQISQEYHACPDYEKLQAKIEELERSQVGANFQDFTQATPEGELLSILSVEGTYVLVDFWASWCRPCRAENPHVVELYKKYKNQGFTVYSVSLDQKREQWINAISKDELIWPNHVSDLQGWRSAAGAIYGVNSIPQTFLIDRKGNIAATNLRGLDLEKKLKEIL